MNPKRILAVICLLSLMAVQLAAGEIVTDTLGTVKSVATGPADLLRGELSGVRVSSVDGSPNGQLNVNIRGLNTLRGDSQPLFIVDGVMIGSTLNNNLNAFYLNGGLTINGDQLPDYSGRSYTSPVGNFAWLNPYEIESIEVLKDISATAMYGLQGANGVVIIKTRKPASRERNIWLNSSVGVDMSSQKGDAFKTGVLTMHDFGVNGLWGTRSFYNISGFLRYNDTAVKNTGSTVGGLAVNMETMANQVFQFGLNSYLNYGDYKSTSGTNFIGQPSAMMAVRYPDLFPNDKLSGWLNSYDDDVIDYRTVNSVWLQVNFLPILKLKLTGGLDYQNQTRYIWYGNDTSFGKEFSGATSILNNSLLNYNFKGELTFARSFAEKHNLQATVAYDFVGNADKTNSMCGTNFDLPYLRGKGLSASASLHAISKFSRTHARMGGYALVGYDYDGFAGIKGTARCDWSPKYDHEPLWMPAGEAYVDFKKILLSDSQVISALKVSGGYGWAGYESVLPYEYMSAYISNVPEVEQGTEPYFDGVNRLLSKEWNVGLDFGLFNDRVNLAVKYYDKNTEDIFRMYNFGVILSDLWVKTPDWKLEHERMSSLRNNGFELDAAFRIIDAKNVKWTAGFNVAYNINSVVTLDETDNNVLGRIDASYLTANMQGSTIGQVLGKDTLPKVCSGLRTALSVYGVTLDARFSGASEFNIINFNNFVEDHATVMMDKYIEKGDYFRLDHLSLAYDIPVKVKWMQTLRVNLAAHNLFTVTDYSGWNPDVNSFGVNARSYGVDYGSFPLRRSVVLGINLRF
jgi:TonB-dependent SusC/RagA subfamily outer membrane receptor